MKPFVKSLKPFKKTDISVYRNFMQNKNSALFIQSSQKLVFILFTCFVESGEKNSLLFSIKFRKAVVIDQSKWIIKMYGDSNII